MAGIQFLFRAQYDNLLGRQDRQSLFLTLTGRKYLSAGVWMNEKHQTCPVAYLLCCCAAFSFTERPATKYPVIIDSDRGHQYPRLADDFPIFVSAVSIAVFTSGVCCRVFHDAGSCFIRSMPHPS